MANLSVLLSTLKMAVATLMSRVLGLVREQVMAAMFGASGLTDAFLVAFRIPNLLRDLFAEGAFSAAFVPTFVEARQESEEEAKKLLWSLFWLLGITTGFIGLGIFLFSDQIITFFAPAFVADATKFQITSNMTKIMSPFLMLVSLAALFMGALNSLKYFFLPSLSPAFFNVASIVSMIMFPTIFHHFQIEEIYVMGLGVLLGGVLQALIQFPLLIKAGYGRPRFGQLLNARSKIILKKLGPGLIGFAATQINLLVNTILATGAGVGAVSWLNYSFRLFQLPVGILSVSIGNSNLVYFSEAWKKGEKQKAVDLLFTSYSLSMLVVMPALVMMVVLGEPIVHLIFERGRFLREDTLSTAMALKMYGIGLPFYSVYKIFVPVMYAIDRQKVPVFCSIGSITFNVLFCWLLVPRYGFKILAMGTTISMFLNVAIMEFVLMKTLGIQWPFFMRKQTLRIMFSAILALLGTVLVLHPFPYSFSSNMAQNILELSLLMGFCAMLYIGTVYVAGERALVHQVLKKLKRR